MGDPCLQRNTNLPFKKIGSLFPGPGAVLMVSLPFGPVAASLRPSWCDFGWTASPV